MKKIILIFIVALTSVSLSVNAQRYQRTNSALTIESWDNNFFQVNIEGRIYDAHNGVFSSFDLPFGNTYVRIFRLRGSRNMLYEVYRGEIYIPRNTHIFAMLNRYNRLEVIRREPMSYHNNHHHNGYDDGPYYNDRQVDIPSLVSAMRQASFESNKLTIAKQALRNNNIYAAGVERIMRQFSFEDSRIEFAKYAYSHCIDPQNYYRVNNAFTFSSSIEELSEFIDGDDDY